MIAFARGAARQVAVRALIGMNGAGTLLAAVTALWGAAILRWVATDSVVPWDSKNQFYAFFRFLADSLHAGTTIFWNPYQYGGLPSIADPQSLVFSPLFLLWAWFDPAPSLRVFDLLVMLHLLIGGLAMAGLGLRRGWPHAASFLAAGIFMLGGAASARLGHSCIIISYGLFPLALLLLEQSLERRSLLGAVAFGITASLIALGRNQVSLMLCLMLVAFCIAACVRSERPLRYLRERLPVLALMGLVVVLITTVPVLLSLQLAALSNRPHTTLAEAFTSSLHPADLASFAFANLFGTHLPNYAYWGPQFTVTPELAAADDSFNYQFFGVIPVMLLLWFGVAGGRLGARGARLTSIILVLSLLFALGRYTPVFEFFFLHVPGFNFFRRPIDGAFLLPIVIALLSGEMLARYVANGLPPFRPLATAAVLAGVIAVITAALSLSSLTGHVAASTRAAVPGLLLLATAAAILVRPAGLRARSAAAMLVSLMAVGELFAWNTASRLNAESRKFYDVLETASNNDAEALRLLDAEIARRHRQGARPRVEIVGLNGPWQNLAVIRKFEATTGYNPLRIGIFDKYVAPTEQGWLAENRKFPATFKGYDCALARALGLEYLVLDRPVEKLKGEKHRGRMELLRNGPDIWIYRLPGAEPRVHFSARVEIADLDLTTLNGEFVTPPLPDRIVVDTETPPQRRYPRFAHHIIPASMSTLKSAAVIRAWRPGEITIDVHALQAGAVVLRDLYYPGWTATVDGRRVPVLRADVLFRAVEVPQGRHTVVFRFEPLSLENLWNAVVSLRAPAVEMQPIGE